MHSCLASLSSLILSFFPWELASLSLSTAKSIAFALEHFNKTDICAGICSLDCSDSSGWTGLSCLLLWSRMEKRCIIIYIRTYKTWHESALAPSQPDLCFFRTWGVDPWARVFVSAVTRWPGVFGHPSRFDSREGGAALFWQDLHRVSLSWACFRTFMSHMSMWRSWCSSESRDKSALLLIISDSLFRGWITAVR